MRRKKHSGTVFGRIEYLPEKLLNLVSRLLQTAFRLLELPFRLLEKLEQKIQAGRRLKKKVGECEKILPFEDVP